MSLPSFPSFDFNPYATGHQSNEWENQSKIAALRLFGSWRNGAVPFRNRPPIANEIVVNRAIYYPIRFFEKKKKQSRSDPSWPKSQFISIPLLNSGNRLHWGNRPIRDNSVKPGKVSSRNVICRWVLSEKKGKFNEGRKTSRSNVADLDRKKRNWRCEIQRENAGGRFKNEHNQWKKNNEEKWWTTNEAETLNHWRHAIVDVGSFCSIKKSLRAAAIIKLRNCWSGRKKKS